jgi:hypothetical protein
LQRMRNNRLKIDTAKAMLIVSAATVGETDFVISALGHAAGGEDDSESPPVFYNQSDQHTEGGSSSSMMNTPILQVKKYYF